MNGAIRLAVVMGALLGVAGCRGGTYAEGDGGPISSPEPGADLGFSRTGTEVRIVEKVDDKSVQLRLVGPHDSEDIQRTGGGREEILTLDRRQLERLGGTSLRDVTLKEGHRIRITRGAEGRIHSIDLDQTHPDSRNLSTD